MATTYLRVDANGVAVESWIAPDGKTPVDCFFASLASTFHLAIGAATIGWTYANETWNAPPDAASPTQGQLAASLIAAAQAASNAITKAIATTEAHLAGYQSAANMVRAANGVPSNDPDKTAFAAISTAVGIDAPTLASLVVNMDAASVTNLAILITLENAVAAATTSAQLATALSAYESSLSFFVSALNGSGLTTTISMPQPINIVGINA